VSAFGWKCQKTVPACSVKGAFLPYQPQARSPRRLLGDALTFARLPSASKSTRKWLASCFAHSPPLQAQKTAGLACPVLYRSVAPEGFEPLLGWQSQCDRPNNREISSSTNRKNRCLRFRDLNLRCTQAAMACVVPSSSSPAHRTPISNCRAGNRGQIQGCPCLPCRRPRTVSTIFREIISCC
jgi:hypothetical protein